MTIRNATMADSEAIRAIRNAAIRDSTAIWTTEELDASEGAAWLKPAVERGTALVAELDGTVVGFAVVHTVSPYSGYRRTVENSVYLSDAARGHGLGTALLSGVVEKSREIGDRTMISLIEANNAASIGMNLKSGFHRAGFIPRAGEKFGQVFDLVIMCQELN